MVVTQKEFKDMVRQLNVSFAALEARVKELEEKLKETKKRTPSKAA
jgi:BMFP domain-containing protein YqiC